MIALFAFIAMAHAGEMPRTPTSELGRTQTPATAQVDRKMPSGYTTASTDSSTPNMCRTIRALGTGNPNLFDTKNPYGLCAPTWKSPTPEWYRQGVAREIQKITDYKPIPRADFLKQKNYKLLSDAQKDGLLSVAKQFREKAATQCCGTNAQCLSAMRAVRIKVCSSPADQNSALEDPCEADRGDFELSTLEQAKIIATTRTASASALTEADRLLANETLSYPVSGGIEFSPYLDPKGEPISKASTIRHELGHACSFIQRQIAAKTSKPAAQSFIDNIDDRCKIDSKTYRSAYATTLKNPHVENCLVDLVQQSTNPKTAGYIPNSCPRQKLEEATAEAFALLTSQLVPEAFPTRACGKWPSPIHAASADVFTCLVKGDATVRKQLAGMFRCQ